MKVPLLDEIRMSGDSGQPCAVQENKFYDELAQYVANYLENSNST
jgi:hypothetical protein